MDHAGRFKIAYCIPSLYIAGGMERVLTLKANYFAEVFGYEIYIIVTDGKDKKPYFPLSAKIKVVNLDINFDDMFGQPFYKRMFQYLKKYPIYKKRLREYLCDLKPDISISMIRREIGFFTSIPDGSIKIGEVHINKDHMHDTFGDKMDPFKKLIAKYWMRRLTHSLRKLDQFVILTHEEISSWEGVNKITVINNPLTFYPDTASDCTAKKLIAVGRYLPVKGMDLLIDSWKLIHERHPGWMLHIYGEGMRKQLTAQIERLHLTESCILEKPVTNIADKYIESSVFVACSRSEGFSLALCEAMACGLPAVSFSSYGPKEIIRHNEDGILVENSHTAEFADKVCYLIENEKIRKQMGRQARINIQRLKIEKIAEQWKELFNSLIEEGKYRRM